MQAREYPYYGIRYTDISRMAVWGMPKNTAEIEFIKIWWYGLVIYCLEMGIWKKK